MILGQGYQIQEGDLPIESAPIISLKEREKNHILQVLQILSGKKETAKKLGISLKTLHNKLRQYQQPAADSAKAVIKIGKKKLSE